jgi:hypothetical protein
VVDLASALYSLALRTERIFACEAKTLKLFGRRTILRRLLSLSIKAREIDFMITYMGMRRDQLNRKKLKPASQ